MTIILIMIIIIIVLIMMTFIICTPIQIISGYKIKMNEMGWARGTNGGHERYMKGFGGET
jgi:hypothetical protein